MLPDGSVFPGGQFVTKIISTQRVANCSPWDGMRNPEDFSSRATLETRNIWVATGHSVDDRVVRVILSKNESAAFATRRSLINHWLLKLLARALGEALPA